MDYKSVIESRYNRQNWQLLLHDIFGNKIKFWNTPSSIPTSSQFAKQALWLGTITLSDEQTIAVYEVELSETVDIERNRRGIRDMLLTDWRNNGNAGAFMFCYRKKESVLRFSYVSESWSFADDGSYQKESTDAKRFTYLLGEGHRSRTAIQQFEKLRDSSLSLKDLTKAFSVDAVSDMFFDGYKKQYEDIIQYVTGKRMVKVANKWEEQVKNAPCEEIMQEFSHFPNPEKAIRDYVKKLMGRIVFLQFLQKKGWMGVPVNKEWGDGDPEFIQDLFKRTSDKDHFIDNVLEPLFEDLNSERINDLVSTTVGNGIRVPYLNGGLFEREATDETQFPLPADRMQSLLEFFASYNFTIDENDPDDAEVGVDPEMLGRIFENLLEDNKDKGAFYTPKEIVTYMCRESLIAYLQTDIDEEDTKEAIRQFVTTHEKNDKLPTDIDQKLKDVKICDPAIGSGAYPMGLLKELFLCRSALEGFSQNQASEIKKHIIQQNIYGVDIERGAVDIARLRFWLSLIVDEETPHALPNLDYKIVEGNSLITTFDGQYIDLEKGKGEARFRPSLININREKKKLQDEQKRFFTLSGDEKYRSEIAIKNHILNIIWYQLDYEKHSWQDATVEQAGLFGAITPKGRKKNKADVVEFTPERQVILDKCEKLMARINDKCKPIQERAGISIPFFEWGTIFSDIFDYGTDIGFDIIIGNPPYGADIDALVDVYGKLYPKTSHGYKDIYKYFFDCFIEKTKENGILCYITPNTYLRQPRYGDLRRVLMEYNLIQLLDLGENIFEEAVVTVAVTLLKNTNKIGEVEFADLTKEITNDNANVVLSNIPFVFIKQSKWKNTPNNIFVENFVEIKAETKTLEELMTFKDAGINYQRVNVGLAQKGKSDLSKRLLYEGYRESSNHIEYWKGTDINEYYISPTTNRFCRPNIDLADNERVILNADYFSIAPKLIWRQTAPYPICVVDYDGVWFGRSIQAGVIKSEYKDIISYEYLCALLNSKYLRYLYEQNVKEEGRVFPQVKLEKLKPLPIIIPNSKQKKEIEDLVSVIMETRINENEKEYETMKNKIDNIISDMYGVDSIINE